MQHNENGSPTPALVETLTAARQYAENPNHGYIGTEHLLLAVLEGRNTTALEVLHRLGADVAALKATVEELKPPPLPPWGTTRTRSGVHPPRTEIPFTTKAQAAYRKAIAPETEFGGVVGTGQMLLALLDPQYIAGAVMSQHGIEVERARRVIRELYEVNEECFRADAWAE